MKINYNRKIEKIDIHLLPILGEGVEGIVYNWKGKALKLYKTSRYDYLKIPTKEQIEYLSEIKLKHFPFAETPIFDKNDHLIGHSAPIITGNIPINSLLYMPIPDLISKLKSIRDDIEVLNENYVLLSKYDFYRNFIYNGDFYFIDHDLYEVYLNQLGNINLREKIRKQNNYIINEFYVINFILKKFEKKPQLQYRKRLISEKFMLQNNLDKLKFEDFLKEIFEKEDIQNVHKYVKKYRKNILKI